MFSGQSRASGRSTEVAEGVGSRRQASPKVHPSKRRCARMQNKVYFLRVRAFFNPSLRTSVLLSSNPPNSAVLQTTLRRTPHNSPPYFDASTAESLSEQGGKSRRAGRRVDRSTAKSLADELGLVKPLTLDAQWMEARCSMDRHTSVNGLLSAIQWIERSDSMDGMRQFNGLTSTPPSR